MKKRVIIIGGGYAGLRLIEHLIPHKDMFEIMLFDRRPYHYMQTEVYDLIANKSDIAEITVDLYTYCAGYDGNVTFYKQEVENINFETKKIITNLNRYSYDYLVLATGSRTKFFDSIEGIKEHAHGIKSLDRALDFKQYFETSLFNRIKSEGSKCEIMDIVVAGGGLSGVEISAQMAFFAKEFFSKNYFLCQGLNITLINAGETILQGLDEYLVVEATKRLRELNINIITNEKVTKVTANEVVLTSGRVISKDFMIFAGGVEPSGLIQHLSLPKDKNGFITIDDYYRVPNLKDVFAIGDNASVIYKEQKLPPTADIAEQMGEILAKNLVLIAKEKTPQLHPISSRGTLIALGGRFALAKVGPIRLKGIIGHLIKQLIVKIYFYKVDNRSRIGYKKIFK